MLIVNSWQGCRELTHSIKDVELWTRAQDSSSREDNRGFRMYQIVFLAVLSLLFVTGKDSST